MIQTKLAINQPEDEFEQEADRVADEVMRTPEDGVSPGMKMSGETQSRPGNRMCAEPVEGERNIQRKEVAGGTPTVTSAIGAILNATMGSGEPLPKLVRSFMEPRFGVDFSRVRVHTGSKAAWLNQEFNSQAFTRQRDIYFGAGKYKPDSAAGKRLLAHELTHVIQQSESTQLEPSIERQNAQETGGFLNNRETNPVLSNVVQRQASPEDAGSEKEIVESVIEAMSHPSPGASAGVSDVDEAFSILNKYSLPFLVRALVEVYDRGYFHGLLGYLAPGTKANSTVIVAIRLIQCQKEPSSLTPEAIREADIFIDKLYDVHLPGELMFMFDCLERERTRHGRQLEGPRAVVRQGRKTLIQGTMDWWLGPLRTYSRDDYRGQASAQIQITFTPNPANKNKTITFLQTVLQTTTSSASTESIPLLDIGTTRPFDPFYGADFS
ncbi:MAG: DUF4157 domain-containing protein, partial [Acidobacteriota bacterium]